MFFAYCKISSESWPDVYLSGFTRVIEILVRERWDPLVEGEVWYLCSLGLSVWDHFTRQEWIYFIYRRLPLLSLLWEADNHAVELSRGSSQTCQFKAPVPIKEYLQPATNMSKTTNRSRSAEHLFRLLNQVSFFFVPVTEAWLCASAITVQDLERWVWSFLPSIPARCLLLWPGFNYAKGDFTARRICELGPSHGTLCWISFYQMNYIVPQR